MAKTKTHKVAYSQGHKAGRRIGILSRSEVRKDIEKSYSNALLGTIVSAPLGSVIGYVMDGRNSSDAKKSHSK